MVETEKEEILMVVCRVMEYKAVTQRQSIYEAECYCILQQWWAEQRSVVLGTEAGTT
jgi:hypothetical protein